MDKKSIKTGMERLKYKIDNDLPIDVIKGKKLFSLFGRSVIWWGMSYGKRCISVEID